MMNPQSVNTTQENKFSLKLEGDNQIKLMGGAANQSRQPAPSNDSVTDE